MDNIPEGRAGSRVLEIGWSPALTVLYVVWCVAAGKPLDYFLLAALVVLSITCIAYARKLRQREVSRAGPVSEAARTLAAVPSMAAAPAGAPEDRAQAAPAETPKPRTAAPAEPRREEMVTAAPAPPPVERPKERAAPPIERPRERAAAVQMEQPAELSEPPRLEPQKSKAAVAEEEAKKSLGSRLLTPEKPSDSGLEKQIEAMKGELERSKQSAAALESELAEHNRRAAERLEVIAAITSVKEQARAFRRQWPDAAFCQRPLRAQWWTPNATQTATMTWLVKAQEWHSHFQHARADYFPGTTDVYLQSLDLEEVIDFLDEIALSRETRTFHRDTQVSSGSAPVVVITSWGAPEGEYEKCGIWLHNKGEVPATNIQLAPAAIGSRRLSIYLPPNSVLEKDKKLFVIASLSGGAQRATAYHLEDVLKKLPANPINGAKPLGIALRLIYESTDGTRYTSRHEMALEDTGVIKVGYLNTEVLCMPV